MTRRARGGALSRCRKLTAEDQSASATTWPSTEATAAARAICPRRGPRHLELKTVTGDDLTAELGVLDAAQPRVPFDILAAGQQQRRHLGERLDHEHARHERRAGKMSLEELFVDGDVLHRDDAVAGLVYLDGVDEN
jgi:hypothetical protein